MDGVMSQEEINALLNGSADSGEQKPQEEVLTEKEKDTIGEIANISMGTAATTLFSLVNRKVEISTPVVSFANWSDICEAYEKPCVFIRIGYTVGLDGSNILVLKEHDVKVITDLMMGGDGTNTDGELGELHLSAISEAMNQMMGSAATSMSSMLNRKIDISPPEAELTTLGSEGSGKVEERLKGKSFVKVSLKMEIGDLVDSNIMQLYPVDFAKELYQVFSSSLSKEEEKPAAQSQPVQPAAQPQPTPQPAPAMAQPQMQMPYGQMPYGQAPYGYAPPMQDVNVQPVQFQSFAPGINPASQQENIDLIMDVPLEVTVELGRTKKSIKEILEFAPGTIVELDKIAGEPIDVLVNGKFVAKGEVVVIEESFGVRITEIIK